MKKIISVASLFIAVFVSSPLLAATESAATSLTIEITQGREQSVKLALIPFDVEVGISLPLNIHNIVLRDMQLSGQISPVPVNTMPSLPVSEAQVIYSEWQELDAEYLLLGQVSRDNAGKRYKVAYKLFDVFGNKKIRDEVLYFTDRSLLDTGHFLSDLVYEEITGIKGIFSTKIAYISITGKRTKKPLFRLEIADIDGKRPQILLSSRQPILSPSWSPDGTHIAYVSYERKKSNIYTQNLRTGKRRLISDFRGINSAPSWSPDGAKIALVLSRKENVDVYIMNMFTGKLDRLTVSPGIDTEPSWSNDGRKILFVSERGNRPQIFEYNFTNKKTRQITTKGKYNTRPRYIENGKSIVFVKQSNGFRLVKKSLITGSETFLSKTKNDESPSVAPNGDMIVYSTKVGEKSQLIVISSDGQVEYRLPSSANEVIDPAWSNYRI